MLPSNFAKQTEHFCGNETQTCVQVIMLLTAYLNSTPSPMQPDDEKNPVTGFGINRADSIWQLRSGFAIMTMQSGFALLETGCVSAKNIANIMIKNIVDVAFGGICYWMVGFALSYGRPSNPFCGWGDFFVNIYDESEMGTIFTQYYFQFSFASTATTIVSGAVAERMNLHAYMVYSFLNTLSYCIPASWIWNGVGFLNNMGFYDYAGSCGVHANGGASAVVAAVLLGPRKDRFEDPEKYTMSSPVTALTGTLILWWAWFPFNCGSSLGSSEMLWKTNAMVAVNTLNGSIGGSLTGFILSMIVYKGHIHVDYIINSVLGGLVGITSICSVTSPLECLFIGAIGAAIAIGAVPVVEWLKIDDPVGAIPVHFAAASWGCLAVGIFADDFGGIKLKHTGCLHGGGFTLLGVQALGLVVICGWSALTTVIFFVVIDKLMGIRMSAEDEELGADFTEHDIFKGGGLRGMSHDDDNIDDDITSIADNLVGLTTNNFPQVANNEQPDFRTLAKHVLIANQERRRRMTLINRKGLEKEAEANQVSRTEAAAGAAGIAPLPHQLHANVRPSTINSVDDYLEREGVGGRRNSRFQRAIPAISSRQTATIRPAPLTRELEQENLANAIVQRFGRQESPFTFGKRNSNARY